jgi:DNA-binding MarR family transcriptional regulator
MGEVEHARPPALLADAEMRAWLALLRSHAAITRRLDGELIGRHGLTLNDYDVLVQLAFAPERRLRMSELADRILLTRSGMTRRADRLERQGLVQRTTCPDDARGAYLELTDPGADLLAAARSTHLAGVREMFTSRLDDRDLEELARILEPVAAAGSG